MSQGILFAVGEKYVLDGVAYRIEQHLDTANLAVRELATGRLCTVTRDELLQAWIAGRFHGQRYGPNLRVDGASPLLRTSYDFPDFQALPARAQEMARQRYALIEPLLALAAAQRYSHHRRSGPSR